MACTPGVNYESIHTGEEIDNAVTQVPVNTSSISALDGRVTTNEGDITQNAGDIAQNKTDITTNATKISQNDADIIQNASDIASLNTQVSQNTTDISTNATDIGNLQTDVSALPSVYAKINGDASQLFDCSDATADTHAVNRRTADSRYAKIAGESNQAFACADPLSPADACPQGWVQNNYVTQSDIQIMIDSSIAAHAAIQDAHHPYP